MMGQVQVAFPPMSSVSMYYSSCSESDWELHSSPLLRMTTESSAPSIDESQQGGNSEAPCSSGCVHVSEELLPCVRGEVINFDDLDDLWDWATDLG